MPNKRRNQNNGKHMQPMEEPEPRPSTSKKDVKKKTSFKKSTRDDARMTDFRAKQSEKTVQENREALFEKLFFAYRNINEAMKHIELQQVQRTIVMPISTCSAGFIIRNLMARFVRPQLMFLDEARTLAGSLYRITLLQLDYKLHMQHSRNLELDSYEETYLADDIPRVLNMMGAGFSPLINYVNAIGYVKTAAKSYLPRHPKVKPNSPIYQTSNTLRATIEALSGEALSIDLKRTFMDYFPYPNVRRHCRNPRRNATGDDIALNVRLENPDDIMPADYSVENVRVDIGMIASAVERVSRKYPKYVSTGGLDWKSQGSLSQIISSTKGNLRYPTWPNISYC
uniref:Uncharacterized protein n=1 Tax=Glossina pallidipes TaxID=7398 RepID=A0A1B0AC59_GLOPL